MTENRPPEPEHEEHPKRFRWRLFDSVASSCAEEFLTCVIIVVAVVTAGIIIYMRLIR